MTSPQGLVAPRKMSSRLNKSPRPLLLASASPRRAELLREVGITFTIQSASVTEVHHPGVGLIQLTRENAALKAWHVAELRPHALVLGADTLVSVDACALGKPADFAEARVMLHRLSGRTHEVCTAVCLACAEARRSVSFEVVTEVTFRPLSDEIITRYMDHCHPLDKAGAYGIQDQGEMIVSGLTGSWTNVMGLPMERLLVELRLFQAALDVL